MSCLLRYYHIFQQKLLYPLASCPNNGSFVGCGCQNESIKQCIGTLLVSNCLRELSICVSGLYNGLSVLLPTSLYTCKSLMSLKLEGHHIDVDVPQIVCLPSLKTLQLRYVTYSSKDSLGLLLSQCLVLEDLTIERDIGDNLEAIVVNVPSLQRLHLRIDCRCSYDEYVIVTPSLKYFKVKEHRYKFSYSFDCMPELEEANIIVLQGIDDKLLESLTSVKRLSVCGVYSNTVQESVYDRADIVYNRLQHLKLFICTAGWSKLLVWLIRNSPKLRVLNLSATTHLPYHEVYQPVSYEKGPVPECLLKSLNTFKFVGYKGRPEERDFLCFLMLLEVHNNL